MVWRQGDFLTVWHFIKTTGSRSTNKSQFQRRTRRLRDAFYLEVISLSQYDEVGYDVRMIQKLIAISAWVILAFIAYATISPIQDRPTLPTSSNFEHVAAFAVLGGLFCLAYPRQIILVCLVIVGSAVLLELIRPLPRTPAR
jgi:hypothetical protein